MARISAAQRRPLLVAAALAVLSRDGLAALSTRAIVAEAGMSLASFHYAYASREELLADLITSVVASERDAGLAGLFAEARTVEDAVRNGIRAYLDLLRADPGREQGMFELTQYALRTPALADLAAGQYRAYHALAVDLLEQVGERYGLTWSVPCEDLARLLIALTDGISLAWLANRDDAAAERLADLAAATLLAHRSTSHLLGSSR